mmetsp:Transcript_15818/g.13832  ORF Transcript_15818/g.13832 Transcript_15818/m.13832 type:complete len:97 (-) Transcript_15818:597-887(-)
MKNREKIRKAISNSWKINNGVKGKIKIRKSRELTSVKNKSKIRKSQSQLIDRLQSGGGFYSEVSKGAFKGGEITGGTKIDFQVVSPHLFKNSNRLK